MEPGIPHRSLPSAARRILVSNPVNVLLANSSNADKGESPSCPFDLFLCPIFSDKGDVLMVAVGFGDAGDGLRDMGFVRGAHGEKPGAVVEVALRELLTTSWWDVGGGWPSLEPKISLMKNDVKGLLVEPGGLLGRRRGTAIADKLWWWCRGNGVINIPLMECPKDILIKKTLLFTQKKSMQKWWTYSCFSSLNYIGT